jgi:hypothetical protein
LCSGRDLDADEAALTQVKALAALGQPALIDADVNELVGVGWFGGGYSSIRIYDEQRSYGRD